MSRTVTIDPVTRIEGHARITLTLGDDGQVNDARFHLTQFRGFEKFCEAARTGRCRRSPRAPAASAREPHPRLEQGLRPPAVGDDPADRREAAPRDEPGADHPVARAVVLPLSSPDLLLGWDADPASRNIFGVMRQDPALARDGIRLPPDRPRRSSRCWGARRSTRRGSCRARQPRRSTPPSATRSWRCCPRGSTSPSARTRSTRRWCRASSTRHGTSATQPTLFLSLVSPRAQLEHYDGLLRLKDAKGNIVEDMVPRRLRAAGRRGGGGLELHEVPVLQALGYPGASTASARWRGSTTPTPAAPPSRTLALAEFRMLQDRARSRAASTTTTRAWWRSSTRWR